MINNKGAGSKLHRSHLEHPKVNESISRWIAIFVLVLFLLILLWLTAVAGTSTAQITPVEFEKTFLVSDSIWLNLFWTAIFFIILMLYQRSPVHRYFINNKRISPHRNRQYFLLSLGILLSLLIILTQKKPMADQKLVMNCVEQWRSGDFSSLTVPGEYLDRYPNQRGLVLILYLLSYVFGTQNYLAFQFANVAALLWFYAVMFRLYTQVCACSNDEASEPLLMLFFLLFLPLNLYVNFVYGTLIGLALSIAALEKLNNLLTSFKWKNAFLSCLLLFFAIVFKQNYLIFAIGFLIALGIHMLEKKDWKLAIPCAGILAVILLSSTVTDSAVTVITNKQIRRDGGVSSLSYVAMGLQENNLLYDGWWNRYNLDTYENNGYHTAEQGKEAQAAIQKRVEEFRQNPEYALRFLAGKNASQWNNPNFQGLWINQLQLVASNEYTPPNWITVFFGFRATNLITAFLNRFQFIILFGAVISVLSQRHRDFLSVSIMLTFIGGFVFHTFWEAKSQYTLPYFVLLLPLSVRGWTGLCQCVRNGRTNRKNVSSLIKNWRITFLAVFLCISMLAQFGNIPFLSDTIRRDEDTLSYRTYLAEKMSTDLYEP